MEKTQKSGRWALSIVRLTLLLAVGCLAAVPDPSRADLAADLIQERAKLAAVHLHDSLTRSGRFIYKRHVDSPHSTSDGYNILRHAGAVYALADFHSEVPASPRERENLARATRFLTTCCARPLPRSPKVMAIWSDPELRGSDRIRGKAKLGGAGLALAALTAVETLAPGTSSRHLLDGIGEFVLFMQEPSGRFISRYVPESGGRDDSWASLYYPGEAVLGLLLLYEFTGHTRWLTSALDGLRYLSRLRDGPAPPPADHWALIATARLIAIDDTLLASASPPALAWNDPEGAPSVRDSLLLHARRIVDTILDEQQISPGDDCLRGGFDDQGRSTPTATRLEGLLSALEFLRSGEQRSRVEKAIESGMAFLLSAQRLTPPFAGSFTRTNPACASTDHRAGEIRIDYTQHALSALVMYLRLIESDFE